MNVSTLITKLQDIADNYKTVYMWGVFGAPVTETIISQKTKQYPSWYTSAKQAELRRLIGKGYFAFDCVNLIKGVLWGWSGDGSKGYGGAVYASGGVPDISADGMIAKCTGVTTNFSGIVTGEAVWLPGHVGVYIGGGKVIECTPIWKNGVQVTACLNIGPVVGLNGRRWTKRGKIPYMTYEKEATGVTDKNTPSPWAKAAWDWAKAKGYLDGSRPKDPVTREELAAVLKNVVDKK